MLAISKIKCFDYGSLGEVPSVEVLYPIDGLLPQANCLVVIRNFE